MPMGSTEAATYKFSCDLRRLAASHDPHRFDLLVLLNTSNFCNLCYKDLATEASSFCITHFIWSTLERSLDRMSVLVLVRICFVVASLHIRSLLTSVHARWWCRTRWCAISRGRTLDLTRRRNRTTRWTVLAHLARLLVHVEASRRKLWLKIGWKALRRIKGHTVWHIWWSTIRREWRKRHASSAWRHHTRLTWRTSKRRWWHSYRG